MFPMGHVVSLSLQSLHCQKKLSRETLTLKTKESLRKTKELQGKAKGNVGNLSKPRETLDPLARARGRPLPVAPLYSGLISNSPHF